LRITSQSESQLKDSVNPYESQTKAVGITSGIWHFKSFGEVTGHPHPHIPLGIVGSIFGAILSAPYIIVIAIVSVGLLWQGLSAIANPD
jgi:hypothetical protein